MDSVEEQTGSLGERKGARAPKREGRQGAAGQLGGGGTQGGLISERHRAQHMRLVLLGCDYRVPTAQHSSRFRSGRLSVSSYSYTIYFKYKSGTCPF